MFFKQKIVGIISKCSNIKSEWRGRKEEKGFEAYGFIY